MTAPTLLREYPRDHAAETWRELRPNRRGGEPRSSHAASGLATSSAGDQSVALPANVGAVPEQTEPSALLDLSIATGPAAWGRLASLPAFRTPVDGPEARLVESFVDWCGDRIGAIVPRGCQVALLREPRLPSGFPDLLFVVWHERTAANWAPNRASLAESDLQLLQYLRDVGGTDGAALATWGGARVHARLERLHAAGLVWTRGRRWIPRAITDTYATRSIVAVEAKVTHWAGAVEQAVINTWFASQSFVLLPHVPTGSDLALQAAAGGVGVWVARPPIGRRAEDVGTHTYPRQILDAPRHPLPRSYGSWLVNEWVCRAVHAGMLG